MDGYQPRPIGQTFFAPWAVCHEDGCPWKTDKGGQPGDMARLAAIEHVGMTGHEVGVHRENVTIWGIGE